MRKSLSIPSYGSLDLAVVQAATFCNLNCDYCYLPDRHLKNRMTPETLEMLFIRLAHSGLPAKRMTVSWHAGEPLIAGIDFYKQALEMRDRHTPCHRIVDFNFQTNGVLLDVKWAKFILQNEISIGLSIDGPEEIHDCSRIYRSGRGSYSKVEKSINVLQDYGIDFSVICVLTENSLNYPREIYEFFKSKRIKSIGFNIEEIEGANARATSSSLEFRDALRRCMSIMFEMWISDGEQIDIREFTSIKELMDKPKFDGIKTQQSQPFNLLNVGWNGDFSTFSPELLGHNTDVGKFVFGNLHTNSLDDSLDNSIFLTAWSKIEDGISRCKEECNYFTLCGGGAPSNKFFENGSLSSTETSYCVNNRKIIIDTVISGLGCAPSVPGG